MKSYTAQDGDTWDSIAKTFGVITSWLILSNALDPASSPPPDPPAAGTKVNIPDDPSGGSVAPGNTNSLDVGAGGIETLRLRLHDSSPKPMTNVRYRVQCNGVEREGTSDDGWVTAAYPAGQCGTVHVEWGAPDENSKHPYSQDFSVDCGGEHEADRTLARLQNLGYRGDGALADAIGWFQHDHGLDELGLNADGSLPDATKAALDQIFGPNCDATRSSPPSTLGATEPWAGDPVPTNDDM